MALVDRLSAVPAYVRVLYYYFFLLLGRRLFRRLVWRRAKGCSAGLAPWVSMAIHYGATTYAR